MIRLVPTWNITPKDGVAEKFDVNHNKKWNIFFGILEFSNIYTLVMIIINLFKRHAEHFGIAPENMVMIGDTSRDVNAAKNIGCHSILINRSDRPSQDYGQEFTVTNAMEIWDFVQF